MTAPVPPVLGHEALECLQLLQWAAFDASAKLDFLEEMVELAHPGGALAPERLAMREGTGAAPGCRAGPHGRRANPST